jgi:hypothetical protein
VLSGFGLLKHGLRDGLPVPLAYSVAFTLFLKCYSRKRGLREVIVNLVKRTDLVLDRVVTYLFSKVTLKVLDNTKVLGRSCCYESTGDETSPYGSPPR